MSDGAKKISWSQYTMWANCGHAWRLKYVDGHRLDDSSIHLIFGTSMHEVIQDWLHVLYNKSENVARTIYLHDVFKTKLLTLFRENTIVTDAGEKVFLADKNTLMEFYNQGCEILTYTQDNYKKLFPTKNTKLFAIEYELRAEIKPGVNYIGYIDIVTYDTETRKYVLYDLKTSGTGWSDYQKKDPLKVGQLLLYKKVFAEQMGIPLSDISVEFVVLKRKIFEHGEFKIPRVSKFTPSNGAPSVKKNWESFLEFVNTAFDEKGEYIPTQTPSPSIHNCKWCVYKNKPELCSFAVTETT
jgi:hypothetical protein